MARASKTIPAGKPATSARKPAASSKAAASSKGRPAPKAAAARKAVAAVPVAKVSKDELRVQVEKFELAHATLRAKSRDMGRAAKAANARIAELEAEVAQLRAQADRAAAAAKRVKPASLKPASSAPKSRRREIDPGDAVPPGVAVEEPEPMDEEAEAARDALEEHLSGE